MHNIDFIKLLVVYKQPRMCQRIQQCFQDIVQVTTALIRWICNNLYRLASLPEECLISTAAGEQ